MAVSKNSCPVPLGTLPVIGGAENKGDEVAKGKLTPGNFENCGVLKCLLKLTGKSDLVIKVITSASADGNDTFDDCKKAIHTSKGDKVCQIHHTSLYQVLEEMQATVTRVKKADVIFFAGGDKLHYTHLYGGTDLLIQLKNKYISDKIVIAGTSAGVMAMSTTMIYAGNEEVQESGGIIKGTTGL